MVGSSWLPYDEARLYALIHSDRAEVDAWLDDHRTLGQLARKRGWGSQRTLARALVAPRLKGVRPAMRPVLERRALETLTQGHLSNHVIFHVFHAPAIAEHAPTIFGLRPATFRHLRDSGLSPGTIAQPRAGQGALRRADGEPRGLHEAHLPYAVAAGQLPLPPALRRRRKQAAPRARHVLR